ncbi:uncharacterized protein LOC108941138 isoform X2 [Scleropages formosus]|uniref:uncharacterized protein LOC108941138 isoform X2 n=1 Tax=Scleropages formosus TaxID=113540 RepID=UPI000878FAAA|nr:uncharacterized protein LOC108941138 isoform X2 [Scleropages formosus]
MFELLYQPAPVFWSNLVLLQHNPELRLYQQWGPVLLLSALWALCQEDVPLYLPVNMDRVLQRVLLAGGSCAALGICVLCVPVLLRFSRQPVSADNLTGPGPEQESAPLLTEEVVRGVAAPQEACAPVEMSSGLPVSTGHALVDSLLVFLHSESLEELSAGRILELAAKLERADEALRRGTAVDTLPRWGSKDGQTLARRLRGVGTYLQQRARLLRTLGQTRGQCEDSERDVVLGLELCWEELEKMHRRIAVPGGTAGDLDVREVLKEVQGLSAELRQRRERLQLCQSHLADTTRVLQELSRNRRELERQAGSPTDPLWTERLLQASAAQNEEIRSKFLSLESIADCLRTHLEGLRVQGRDSASSTCPPTPVETPPAELSPPPSPSPTSRSLIPALDCLCGSVRRR